MNFVPKVVTVQIEIKRHIFATSTFEHLFGHRGSLFIGWLGSDLGLREYTPGVILQKNAQLRKR